MSNGYVVAAAADVEAGREIAAGFGLELITADTIGDVATASTALASAANVGLLLTEAAAADARFVALMQALPQKLAQAQLIVASDQARAAFAFLPAAWPSMSLDDARARLAELARRRQAEAPASQNEAPAPQARDEAPEPQAAEAPAEPQAPADETPAVEAPVEEPAPADASVEAEPPAEADEPAHTEALEAHDEQGGSDVVVGAPPGEQPRPPEDDAAASVEAPPPLEEAQAASGAASAPTSAEAPDESVPPPLVAPAPAPSAPSTPAPPRQVHAKRADSMRTAAPAAPADATAFAPKKLRRGTPELVRLVVHQPKDLADVIKAAKKIDPRTDAAPQGMRIGDVALGSSIGVALEVRGAACDGALQRRTWAGEPIDFNFSVEADESAKQAVFVARVFIDDAQIGTVAFTRKIAGPAKKPASEERVRLKRYKRVFLSYSSNDRETVAVIATAYARAGVPHFWDRASLKSGEQWHPRLRQEIDRADLFHLCWSKAAAGSEWVEKEAQYALTKNKRTKGKAPEITVQMLDGPPWAKHPASLDEINFDDFTRAAIVGYARGDGD